MIGAAATRNRAAETLGLAWILAALALGGVNQPAHAGQQFQFDTPANLFKSGVTKDVAITDDDAAEDPETFEVTLSNPQGDGDFPEPTLVSPDTATVTINNPNEAPDVTDAGLTTDEDTQGSVTLSASDPDGDSLNFSVVSDPSDGSASVDNSGTTTYKPDGGFTGSDSFTVKVSDGNGGRATASVDVTVNATSGDGGGSDSGGGALGYLVIVMSLLGAAAHSRRRFM